MHKSVNMKGGINPRRGAGRIYQPLTDTCVMDGNGAQKCNYHTSRQAPGVSAATAGAFQNKRERDDDALSLNEIRQKRGVPALKAHAHHPCPRFLLERRYAGDESRRVSGRR